MPAVTEHSYPLYLEHDGLILDLPGVAYGIWRTSCGEGWEAFVEPVERHGKAPLTRDDLCRLFLEADVERHEAGAATEWIERGGEADFRAARAEERYDMDAAA